MTELRYFIIWRKTMKKYIRSASSEELRRKLDLQLEKERIADLVRPIAQRIKDEYFSMTGFKLSFQKYYYRDDLNAVLFETFQFYNGGYTYLITYTGPGRARPSHPAMISLDASDNEIYDYVDRLVDKLIKRIQSTFDSWTTVAWFDGEDESIFDSESVIASIVEEANCDKSRAANFVRSLLNSGEVVNKLRNYVAEDDKGYYLIDEKGKEVHYGTLDWKREKMRDDT